MVLKWRDVRDVKILSSKRISIMVSNMDSSYRNRLPKINPLAVTAYNNKKFGIDRNDQMESYATTIWKSIKWSSKLAIHLLIGISIINAYVIY